MTRHQGRISYLNIIIQLLAQNLSFCIFPVNRREFIDNTIYILFLHYTRYTFFSSIFSEEKSGKNRNKEKEKKHINDYR